MWKVVQRKTGYPHGECVRASYASLFELPIEKVPPFDPASLGINKLKLLRLGPTDSQAEQLERERQWLRSIGFDLIVIPIDRGASRPKIPKDLYHLLSTEALIGPKQEELGHRVVGQGGEVAWDPHPGGSKIIRIKAILIVVSTVLESDRI